MTLHERILQSLQPEDTAKRLADRLGEPTGRVLVVLNELREAGMVTRRTWGSEDRPVARWTVNGSRSATISELAHDTPQGVPSP